MERSLIILFSFCWLLCSFAQEKPVRFQHLTAKEGLSQGHVLCLIQDSHGYIWAGTYHGLNRYNGYNYNVFYADNNPPYSLFINVVYSLYEDHEGKIWCGTWGVDIFDPEYGTFFHIPTCDDENCISAGEVSAILEDDNGFMWFATMGGGLDKYEPSSGKITWFRSDQVNNNALKSDYINDLVLDNNSNLWIATEDGGLSKMNLDTETIKTYRFNASDPYSIPSDKISCLLKDREGKIWLGDNNGYIACYNNDKDRFKSFHCCPGRFAIEKARIMQMAQNLKGEILLATMGAGLMVFDPATKSSSIFLHNVNDPESIISNENSSLLVDKTGSVFLGSYGRGISKYSPFSSKFKVYTINEPQNTSIELNAFTDAIEDHNGHLIVGTYDGFVVFNKKNWTYKHYLPGSSYEDNKILTLELGPDGNIWLSSMQSLHRYDAGFKKVRSYNFDSSIKDHSIYSIEFDHENNLWIALFRKGLIRIPESEWRNTQKSSLDYEIYQTDYNDTTSISGNQQWIIQYTSDSNLWIGGVGGLCRYNYETDNFTRIFNPGSIKTFDFDSHGRIWAGTIGDGLFMYDLKNGQEKRYTVNEGLSHSFIYGVIVDKDDLIWITSEDGLDRFNMTDESFRNYDLQDGLPNDHFDDKSESELNDGSIYMGTNNGFIIFRPEEIHDDTSSSQIVLTGLSIDNKPLKFYKTGKKRSEAQIPVNVVKRIDLQPNEKDIILHFAALHFAAPHKIQYAYMLKGYDQDWIQTDATNRQAKYTNLDGGQYTFIVRATNSDGFWTNKPLQIEVFVHPPFYKTTTFVIFLIFGLFITTFLIFRWRLSTEVRQKIVLEKIVDERTLEISETNRRLKKIALDLRKSNSLLRERQQFIEEQSEELETQRDELAISNNLKDKLFSVIAHDLKNPFNVIMGYSELLLANFTKWNKEKILYFITLLRETSENAYSLLENLLNWSRSQSGSLNFNPSQHSVKDVLQVMINELNSAAQKKEIKLNYKMSPADLKVNADLNMLTAILRNLITNAIKFSNKEGKVEISADVYLKNWVVFGVKDYGIGIDQGSIEDLFHISKSKTSSGTEGEKGTGLGLIICKDFIEYHKGKIWVESKPGKETTFYFTIPIAV